MRNSFAVSEATPPLAFFSTQIIEAHWKSDAYPHAGAAASRRRNGARDAHSPICKREPPSASSVNREVLSRAQHIAAVIGGAGLLMAAGSAREGLQFEASALVGMRGAA
jgi:hypothetical protein